MEDSVAFLLPGLRQADNLAVAALWDQYSARLIRLARSMLNGVPRQVEDEEDVALSVFNSLCMRSARGEFEKLDDRDDLWRILIVITRRKTAANRRHHRQMKRDFRRCEETSLEHLLADAPSPDELASMNDEFEYLLGVLPDDMVRQVAIRRMEGDEIDEIASKLRISPRSVDRKLNLIRVAWTRQLGRMNERPSQRRVVPR